MDESWLTWAQHIMASGYGWTPVQVDDLTVPEFVSHLRWLERHPPLNIVVGEYLRAQAVAGEDKKTESMDRALSRMGDKVVQRRDMASEGKKLLGVVVRKTGEKLFGDPGKIGAKDGGIL